MKKLLVILLVAFIISCKSPTQVDSCSEATFVEFISYNGQVNRAVFDSDSTFYIHLDYETASDLTKGKAYTLCFDNMGNFKSIN